MHTMHAAYIGDMVRRRARMLEIGPMMPFGMKES
jgi:hypothetical protein